MDTEVVQRQQRCQGHDGVEHMKKCGCEECSCHYPLETFLGQASSAGVPLPLETAIVIFESLLLLIIFT